MFPRRDEFGKHFAVDRIVGQNHIKTRKTVSRFLSFRHMPKRQSCIWDAHCCSPLATYPMSVPEKKSEQLFTLCRVAHPIWSCTTRGLPCLCIHTQSGALLPHHFTRSTRMWWYTFCCTIRHRTHIESDALTLSSALLYRDRTFLINTELMRLPVFLELFSIQSFQHNLINTSFSNSGISYNSLSVRNSSG